MRLNNDGRRGVQELEQQSQAQAAPAPAGEDMTNLVSGTAFLVDVQPSAAA
jgi:hypothetical protein